METVTLNVTGMVCGGCSNSVKQALLALDGVVSAEVSHATGEAVVSFDRTKASASQLEAAIKAAGYGIAA